MAALVYTVEIEKGAAEKRRRANAHFGKSVGYHPIVQVDAKYLTNQEQELPKDKSHDDENM